MEASKRKHTVLQEMSEFLYKVDPMHLRAPHEDEYDSEALSILARMNEALLVTSDDRQVTIELVTAIVKNTFEHWFSPIAPGIPEELMTKMCDGLLDIYVSSYPCVENTGDGV